MAPKTHSKFGASKMSRILACPGSVALEEKFPDKKGADAQTGSVAHRVAEKALLNKCSTDVFIGKDVLMEDGSIGFCDEEMAKAVQVYVDEVRRWEAELPGAVVAAEIEGSLEWIDKDCWGTNDVAIRQTFGTLVVLDYKHGAGVPVDVLKEDGSVNPQLMQYALQALGKPPKSKVENYETVIVGIVQPRSFHPDGPVRYAPAMAPEQIREWGDTVLKPGIKAAKKRNAPLHAGDQCRFCKAAQGCPEIHRQANAAALDAFGPGDEPQPLDPVVMTPEQIAKVLKYEKLLGDWVKSVKERAFAMAAGGEEIPGFKLVKKKTHRKWKRPTAEIQSMLLQLGIDQDAILTKRDLLSPAQIEKVLKTAKVSIPIDELTEAPDCGCLAPVTDKRLPWTPKDAASMFEEIESEE